MSRTDNAVPRILLVEDSTVDAMLMRQSLKSEGVEVELVHVENGMECMAFLRREGAYADAFTPDLIFLDLNMPRMNGQEVMEAINADPGLCHLPVIVLSTSSDQRDVRSMYQLRCNTYFTKPMDVHKFRAILRNLFLYWFEATLPLEES